MQGIGEVSTFAVTSARLRGRVVFFRGFAQSKVLPPPTHPSGADTRQQLREDDAAAAGPPPPSAFVREATAATAGSSSLPAARIASASSLESLPISRVQSGDACARAPSAQRLTPDAGRELMLGLGLRAEEGSIAALTRLAGEAADTGEPTPVSTAINAVLSRCVASALRTDGKLAAVRGAEAHCMEPPTNAASGGDAGGGGGGEAARASAGADPPAVGVGSGALLHGHVGTSRQRFHTVVGFAPRAAEAAAADAAQRGAKCLAAYPDAAPPDVAAHLRPIDVWAFPAAGGAPQHVAVEQPDLAGLRAAAQPGAFNDAGDAEASSEEGTHRALYARALLRGCADSLRGLREMADSSDGLGCGDPVLAGVAAQLGEHQKMNPNGAPFRVVAAPHAPAGSPVAVAADAAAAAGMAEAGVEELLRARDEERQRWQRAEEE
eukprot:gene6272-1776_t